MSDLATRLREHVDTAAPPIDIEALLAQLQFERTVATGVPLQPRARNWAYALGAAAVVLILVGGAALLFSGSDLLEPADTTLPPSTTVPEPSIETATAFDLATDDFCDWLAAEEINQMIASAQQRTGTDADLVPLDDAVGSCSGVRGLWWASTGWTQNPAEEGSMMIALHRYSDDPDASVGPEWFHDNPEWFDRHNLLDEAVGYHVSRHNVAYDAGVQIQLRVAGQEDILVFAFGVGDAAAVHTPKYEELGLAIANEMLRQMNWIDD